jgi:CheY-like chemotaxis protein
MNTQTLQTIDLVGTKLNPKRKMLLVEDSHDSEVLMRHLCSSVNKDINIKCVQSGELAIHLLEDSPPYDLIISDHFLAGSTTGLDLWKVCKTRFKQIPFMMTSGFTEKEFLQLVTSSDHPLYLPKKVDTETSKKMLKDFFETEEDRNDKFKDALISLYKKIVVTGVFLLACLIPNHTITRYEMLALLQPQQTKHLDVEPRITTHTKPTQVDIKNFIAFELKQKIAQIVQRTEEIKTDTLFMDRNFYSE